MMTEELLARLERPRKTLHGWTARCPSHEDRSPSLSIKEGERGLLIRCWAGCTAEEICGALGIPVRELFFDSHSDGPTRREIRRQAQTRKQQREAISRVKGAQADLLREGEAVIKAATGVDISGLSDEQLDRVMDEVCAARALLIQEERDEWTG